MTSEAYMFHVEHTRKESYYNTCPDAYMAHKLLTLTSSMEASKRQNLIKRGGRGNRDRRERSEQLRTERGTSEPAPDAHISETNCVPHTPTYGALLSDCSTPTPQFP